MSHHSDYKHKRSKMAKNEQNKNIHMEELVHNRCSEKVRENFFRPAYGKIGERREEKYGEC